jgi:hypothetical protein
MEIPEIPNTKTMNDIMRILLYVFGTITFTFLGSMYNSVNNDISSLKSSSVASEKEILQLKADRSNYETYEKSLLNNHNFQFDAFRKEVESFKTDTVTRMREYHEFDIRLDSKIQDLTIRLNSLNDKLNDKLNESRGKK